MSTNVLLPNILFFSGFLLFYACSFHGENRAFFIFEVALQQEKKSLGAPVKLPFLCDKQVLV